MMLHLYVKFDHSLYTVDIKMREEYTPLSVVEHFQEALVSCSQYSRRHMETKNEKMDVDYTTLSFFVFEENVTKFVKSEFWSIFFS